MAKALTIDGRLTECRADPDMIGYGRCNHICHQKNGESIENFLKRAEKVNTDDNIIVGQSDSWHNYFELTSDSPKFKEMFGSDKFELDTMDPDFEDLTEFVRNDINEKFKKNYQRMIDDGEVADEQEYWYAMQEYGIGEGTETNFNYKGIPIHLKCTFQETN